LAGRVAALGGGKNFALYTLYEKLGPNISSVLSSDENGVGEIFSTFAPAKGGAE
jgi:hypothetical protein